MCCTAGMFHNLDHQGLPEMKTALVTGGSGGLGLCLVRKFLESGYRVITLSRRGTSENGAESHCVDLRNDTEVGDFIHSIKSSVEKLDVLVNNAAISSAARILNASEESFDETLKVNFISAQKLTEAFLPLIATNGAIVNIISRVGFEGRIGLCAYASSKGLLAGYTLHLAERCRHVGVRVYGVNPGFMVTDMVNENAVMLQKKESLLGVVSVPERSADMIYLIIKDETGIGPIIDIDSRIYQSWNVLS